MVLAQRQKYRSMVKDRNLRNIQLNSVQLISLIQLFATQWTAACQSCLSFTVYLSLIKLMCIELVIPSNYLTLCHPLFFLPSIFPRIRVFSNELILYIKQPKYWSFIFSISPSNEYSELISFRIDCFDVFAPVFFCQESSPAPQFKTSILRHSGFFMVQLTSIYDYWKNHSFDYTDLC